MTETMSAALGRRGANLDTVAPPGWVSTKDAPSTDDARLESSSPSAAAVPQHEPANSHSRVNSCAFHAKKGRLREPFRPEGRTDFPASVVRHSGRPAPKPFRRRVRQE